MGYYQSVKLKIGAEKSACQVLLSMEKASPNSRKELIFLLQIDFYICNIYYYLTTKQRKSENTQVNQIYISGTPIYKSSEQRLLRDNRFSICDDANSAMSELNSYNFCESEEYDYFVYRFL